ncbi:PREDICTED: ras-related protein Rab-7L1-like [Amphimedon queenslandica]|uniref:Ras-related protein Rab n=1 Tax=Amphimedon queenslandica TaxID=400682 RepID=A0A1X7VRM3_AMPQE|nr:PREDICTED: ras-related protein Rab-7L1-like [Amphimedon queenslandica]|eukprot:XP_003383085.1 PREDICTED: ras-related protein Rab-7L1-like [Amphimedon queenslandica]
MCESVFKVLLIGDHSVGKTTFVASYVLNKWVPNLKTTVGADYAVKSVKWSETETIRLHLWDIAGQERFHSIARTYFRGASGCVVMFDVTNNKSFESAREWKQELDSKVELPNGEKVPCVLLGNKDDLVDKKVVTQSQVDKFARENGFIHYSFCSVKEGKGITEPMSELIKCMLEQEHSSGEVLQAFDRLNPDIFEERSNSGCCSKQ